MDKIEWIAPCHFGLESVLKREVEQLGYEIVQVEDGRVTFRGGAEAKVGRSPEVRSSRSAWPTW